MIPARGKNNGNDGEGAVSQKKKDAVAQASAQQESRQEKRIYKPPPPSKSNEPSQTANGKHNGEHQNSRQQQQGRPQQGHAATAQRPQSGDDRQRRENQAKQKNNLNTNNHHPSSSPRSEQPVRKGKNPDGWSSSTTRTSNFSNNSSLFAEMSNAFPALSESGASFSRPTTQSQPQGAWTARVTAILEPPRRLTTGNEASHTGHQPKNCRCGKAGTAQCTCRDDGWTKVNNSARKGASGYDDGGGSRTKAHAASQAAKGGAKRDDGQHDDYVVETKRGKHAPFQLSDLIPVSRKGTAWPLPYTTKAAADDQKKGGKPHKGLVHNPNPADATEMIVRKRKEKEGKKKKKMSSLKKSIIKDRAERLGKMSAAGNAAGSGAAGEAALLTVDADDSSCSSNEDLDSSDVSASDEEQDGIAQKQTSSQNSKAKKASWHAMPSAVTWFAPPLIPDRAMEQDLLEAQCLESGALTSTSFTSISSSQARRISWACVDAPEFLPSKSTEDRVGAEAPGADKSANGTGKGERVQLPLSKGSLQAGEGGKKGMVTREYCQQPIDEGLNKMVEAFLHKLNEFQERNKLKDPVKAKMKRRLSSGLREVHRSIRTQEAKMIVVTPNIEAGPSEGGLDEKVRSILSDARKFDVPVVFALSRNRLSKALNKNMRMSAIAVHDVNGVHDQYKEIIAAVEVLKSYSK